MKSTGKAMACADPHGGGGGGGGAGGPDLPEKSQYIGFRSSPKMTKLPSQHSMSGHHRHASETPFKWRFAGGPMMARL